MLFLSFYGNRTIERLNFNLCYKRDFALKILQSLKYSLLLYHENQIKSMFQAGVSSVDDEDIDLLMGIKTPGADNLLGGEKKEELQEKKELPKKEVKQSEVRPLNPEEEVDSLLGGEDPKEEQDENGEILPKKKPGPAPKAKLPESTEVNYEAIYNDMVAQGLWDEVELPDGKTWDKDTFAQVQKLQVESQVESLKEKIGPVGKSIMKYEENGGDPKEIFNLYKEQEDIREYDISDADGQEEFLRAYYEAQNYSEKSIDRAINALKLNPNGSELAEEAQEKKGLWDAQYEEVIQARQNEQAAKNAQMQEAIKNFEKNITTTLTADSEVTPKERKDLEAYILSYNKNYQGRKVSQFYEDMAEIQKDPKNYKELAKFIKGLKNGEYTKKIADKAKKETSVASYLKIKNGAALKLGDDREVDIKNSDKGSSFITLLNKKY